MASPSYVSQVYRLVRSRPDRPFQLTPAASESYPTSSQASIEPLPSRVFCESRPLRTHSKLATRWLADVTQL